MKNIHLIATDKPSRVYKHLGRELKHTVRYFEQKGLLCINQHIYITNDEEIKEGDYRLNIQRDYFKKSDKEGLDYYNKRNDVFKKIILTTDKDLIADGVQAIDDEFLEWFVKNPSCESIEVGYGWIRLTETDNEGYWISIPDNQFEMQQEEPKQETLEEAAKRYADNQSDTSMRKNPLEFSKSGEELWEEAKEDFKAGAKWKEEKMYSEEEIFNLCRDFAIFVQQKRPSYKKQLEWFEQFKKK